jgi:hypothetical protein
LEKTGFRFPDVGKNRGKVSRAWKKSFQGLEKFGFRFPGIGKFGTDFSKGWKKYLAPGRGGRRPDRYCGQLFRRRRPERKFRDQKTEVGEQRGNDSRSRVASRFAAEEILVGVNGSGGRGAIA